MNTHLRSVLNQCLLVRNIGLDLKVGVIVQFILALQYMISTTILIISIYHIPSQRFSLIHF